MASACFAPRLAPRLVSILRLAESFASSVGRLDVSLVMRAGREDRAVRPAFEEGVPGYFIHGALSNRGGIQGFGKLRSISRCILQGLAARLHTCASRDLDRPKSPRPQKGVSWLTVSWWPCCAPPCTSVSPCEPPCARPWWTAGTRRSPSSTAISGPVPVPVWCTPIDLR
jgi:hypothetical protein